MSKASDLSNLLEDRADDFWDQLNKKDEKSRKRISLTHPSYNEWVWVDDDWGDKSIAYSSRGTAEQMRREGKIEW